MEAIVLKERLKCRLVTALCRHGLCWCHGVVKVSTYAWTSTLALVSLVVVIWIFSVCSTLLLKRNKEFL
jgi:hypothetical protein